MSRPFILCADDYGITPGVDDAILDLCARGRLTAVSAMVTAPAWRADAPRLRAVRPGVEVGIHLSFTEFAPLTGASSLAPAGRPRGQAGLLAAALAGALRSGDLAREIERQIEAFTEAMGRRPDFVDGHQHVHQFPRLAPALVGVLAARAAAWRPWLRVCAEPSARIRARRQGVVAAWTASVMGRALRRRALARGIAVNDGISGFYDVRKAARYAALFPSFLRAMGPRHLVVCHPGRCADDAERSRPWMGCREHEYAFLASRDFADLCARENVRVATFAAIGGAQSSASRSTR